MSVRLWNFLTERLDEDRTAASTLREQNEYEAKARQMFYHRRMLLPPVDRHQPPPRPECVGCDDGWPCVTLMVLSHAYESHPDFDMKWRRPFGQAAPEHPTKMEK